MMIDFLFSRKHDKSSKFQESKLLKMGDVLVNSTGVGTLGKTAVVKRLEQPVTADSHVTIVRTNTALANQFFVGYSLTEKQKEVENLGEGSTGQTELSRGNLGKLKLLLPSGKLQNTFGFYIKSIFEKISKNELENQQLSNLRDWLLPMLMNGQVKVSEAEEILSMAAEPRADYAKQPTLNKSRLPG